MARSWTPSPWANTWAAMGDDGDSAPVTTKRIEPCSNTYDARSITPVSGPA